jgi:hypothetical protein
MPVGVGVAVGIHVGIHVGILVTIHVVIPVPVPVPVAAPVPSRITRPRLKLRSPLALRRRLSAAEVGGWIGFDAVR